MSEQDTKIVFNTGEEAKIGDVIRWHVEDNDDMTTYTFTGLYKGDKVIYLGGGIDFGQAIGKRIDVAEVLAESLENDEWAQGITKVCTAIELASYIGRIEPPKQNKEQSK
jgi:hypothetical protein